MTPERNLAGLALSNMSEYLLSIFPLPDQDKKFRLSCVALADMAVEPNAPFIASRVSLEHSLEIAFTLEKMRDILRSIDDRLPVYIQVSRQEAHRIGFLPFVN